MGLFHEESRGFYDALFVARGVQSYLPLLDRLGTHHPESRAHSFRVGLRAVDLGMKLGLNGTDIRDLGYAGLYHDVGKQRVLRYVLDKPGPLTGEERELMEGHVRLSFVALNSFPYERVRPLLVTHHEHTEHNPYPRNGTERRQVIRGTPDRRKKKRWIDTLGPILTSVDMFDGLSTPRCYRPALPLKEIEKILHEQFSGDPELVDLVLEQNEVVQ